MMDMLTLTVAALAALECVAGRVCAMHPKRHRLGLQIGYLLGAGICIFAGLWILQGVDARWLDAAAWGVALYLLLTWGDWRHGPPLTACRPQPVRYSPRDLVPSSQFDDGRR